MESSSDSLSKEAFTSMAEQFGYRYTSVSPRVPEGDEGVPLFEGLVGIQDLPCGISLCASDLKTIVESEHDGIVSRSLTIAVSLDGVSGDCAFGKRGRLFLGPGMGAVVSVADAVRLANRLPAGQRYQCLLARVCPEDLVDDEVAEQVEALLRGTTIVPLPMTLRTNLLVEELYSPSTKGGVGRLLAESCALELLARALLANQGNGENPYAGLSANDHAGIARVRDKILAEPEREHTLEDLAREAALSVSALKAKFPVVEGQPVFSFLREVRMSRAREGIEREGWTVSQAAYFVGYRHPSNFSTAFRRKFGIAPRDLLRC